VRFQNGKVTHRRRVIAVVPHPVTVTPHEMVEAT
jgi:hypothetical protein